MPCALHHFLELPLVRLCMLADLRIKYGQTDGRRFAQRQPPHFQGAWSARYTLQLQNFIVRNVRIVIYLYDYDVLVLCYVV